jgi:thiamine pyrophosphate-dependent acetolactate synthase large subunit-like protein
VLVFNDNQYGVIRYLQAQAYHRSGEVDLVNPDFLAGRAAGVGPRVSDPAGLPAAMEAAFARDIPTLIEIPAPWCRRGDSPRRAGAGSAPPGSSRAGRSDSQRPAPGTGGST